MFAAGMIASATGWFWGTFEHLLPLKCGQAMRMSAMAGVLAVPELTRSADINLKQ